MPGDVISFFGGGGSEEIRFFLTLNSGTWCCFLDTVCQIVGCCLSRETSVFLQTAYDLAQYSQTLQHEANSTLEILLTILLRFIWLLHV